MAEDRGSQPQTKAVLSLLQIMAERKNAKALACGSLQERNNVNLDVPLQGKSVATAPFLVVLSILVKKQRVSDGSVVFLISLKTMLDSTNTH